MTKILTKTIIICHLKYWTCKDLKDCCLNIDRNVKFKNKIKLKKKKRTDFGHSEKKNKYW